MKHHSSSSRGLLSWLVALVMIAALVAIFCHPAQAQTDPPVAAATTPALDADTGEIVAATTASLTWQQSLIVVLTPLIIAGLKKAVPSVPKGLLPFLAPILGALLEVVSHLTTGADLNVWAALALGAAGVGLREALKQLKHATLPPIVTQP